MPLARTCLNMSYESAMSGLGLLMFLRARPDGSAPAAQSRARAPIPIHRCTVYVVLCALVSASPPGVRRDVP